jgi:membrane-bound ClpP family serine protease
VRRGAKPDVPTLVAGLALLALGVVLLLDSLGSIHASFATIAPIACAAVGAILLASGLTRRD